jgi:hypothetical protein
MEAIMFFEMLAYPAWILALIGGVAWILRINDKDQPERIAAVRIGKEE